MNIQLQTDDDDYVGSYDPGDGVREGDLNARSTETSWLATYTQF